MKWRRQTAEGWAAHPRDLQVGAGEMWCGWRKTAKEVDVMEGWRGGGGEGGGRTSGSGRRTEGGETYRER